MAGMRKLELWYEFASTYSYLSAMRIEKVAAAAKLEVTWRPFLLGPIFRAQGWNDSPFNIYPAKGAYMWRDLARICARQGLRLKKPSAFPRNGLLAARIACRYADESWAPEFVRRVYAANFRDDVNADGQIKTADANLVKTNKGHSIP
jgi:2-hydroxychromene-2-carboxylate isomerase